MNVEGSRDPERYVLTFLIPPHLSQDQARNLFISEYKPRTFKLEGYTYYPQSGTFAARGYDRADG